MSDPYRFIINVSYPSRGHRLGISDVKDYAIRQTAGEDHWTGSGSGLGTRDNDFGYPTRDAALAAIARLKALQINGLRVDDEPIDMEQETPDER